MTDTRPTEIKAAIQAGLNTTDLNILTLHLAGCGTRRIAHMLGLSRTTVKDRLTHIRTTLGKETA